MNIETGNIERAVNAMDAGELREYLAVALGNVQAPATIGFALDRLAAITGVPLPEVMRELADDVEAFRAGAEAAKDDAQSGRESRSVEYEDRRVTFYAVPEQGAWYEDPTDGGPVGTLYAPMKANGSFDIDDIAEIEVSYADAAGEPDPFDIPPDTRH